MVPAIFHTFRDIFSADALHPFKNAGLVVEIGIDALSDIDLAVINLKNGQIGEKQKIYESRADFTTFLNRFVTRNANKRRSASGK